MAAKLQLACFQRLGAPGWRALEEVAAAARDAGLLVIADGKRGDVPITAAAYGQSLFTGVETPLAWSPASARRRDRQPAARSRCARAAGRGGGRVRGGGVLARAHVEPGAADLVDPPVAGSPLHELLAGLVADGRAFSGARGPSDGSTSGRPSPRHLARSARLMPASIFSWIPASAPGRRCRPASTRLRTHPAAAIITASRSIANADDPGAAAGALRDEVWAVAASAARRPPCRSRWRRLALRSPAPWQNRRAGAARRTADRRTDGAHPRAPALADRRRSGPCC